MSQISYNFFQGFQDSDPHSPITLKFLLGVIGYEFAAVDMNHPLFLFSMITITFNPLFWNAIGMLEHHTRIPSKFLGGGNRQVACYVFAAIVFALGIIRDILFKAAVDTHPKTNLVGPISSGPVALLIMAIGNVLVLSSMWKLGLTGTYLGDHFGITLKEKIVGFPFNFLEHPMYDGASMIFAGYALWSKSIAGLVLACYATMVYKIAGKFEAKFTEKIYSKTKKSQKTTKTK